MICWGDVPSLRAEPGLPASPSPHDWLPDDHLAYFVLDLVKTLDVQRITAHYEREERGYVRSVGAPSTRRKVLVEPVFGQIKGARGIRAFLLRGLANVRGEWSLITLTHNLLKLYRSQLV